MHWPAFIFPLLQTAPNMDPIQWSAPIPNDVEWEKIVFCLICGAAILAYGINRVFARWQTKGWISDQAPFYGEAIGLIIIPLLTGYAGYLVWHFGMGVLCGIVGGWASPWFIDWLNKLIAKGLEKRWPFRKKP